jgi:hypothetical protein
LKWIKAGEFIIDRDLLLEGSLADRLANLPLFTSEPDLKRLVEIEYAAHYDPASAIALVKNTPEIGRVTDRGIPDSLRTVPLTSRGDGILHWEDPSVLRARNCPK